MNTALAAESTAGFCLHDAISKAVKVGRLRGTNLTGRLNSPRTCMHKVQLRHR